MYAKLPRLELAIYFAYWLFCFSKILGHFYEHSRELEKDSVFVNWALLPGYFLNFNYREKFCSMTEVIIALGPPFVTIAVVHVIVRRIVFGIFIRHGHPWRKDALALFLWLFGFFGVSHLVGYYLSGFFLILALVNYFGILNVMPVLPIFKSMSPLWRAWTVLTVQTIGMQYFTLFQAMKIYQNSLHTRIGFSWSVAWYGLRLVSYMHSKSRFGTGIKEFLAYIFYLPIFFGPFVSYERFLYGNELIRDDKTGSQFRPLTLRPVTLLFLKKSVTVFVWTIATIFTNHAFFPIAVVRYTDSYAQMNFYGRFAHAWLLGQYFQAKYMFKYGVPWLVALLDSGTPLPDLPIFISRVFRYSVMWRRFDAGMYEFLRDHLYRPMFGKTDDLAARHSLPILESPIFKKVFVAGIVYLFVGVWHGVATGVKVFALMNFTNFMAEYLGSSMNEKYSLSKRLSPLMYRRMLALGYMFTVQWSWISFFMFVTSKDIGTFMVWHLYYQPLWQVVLAELAMYAWVHLAMELEMLLDEPPKPKMQQSEATKKKN